jgi:phenylacetic acid degradation operon negative regulatory protein
MSANRTNKSLPTLKPKTEELLYVLLWSCEMLSRPTWLNLTESFEGWAYRNGFHRQLARLEKLQLVERVEQAADERVHRLTEAGRLWALGGRDPETCWRRPWDGRWRLVLFDVPLGQDAARNKLRSYLRDHGFGYLQNSVWITPDPLTNERQILAGGAVNVESLILLEARPCAGESDAEIVAGAWDFDLINRRYAKLLEVVGQRPRGRLITDAAAKAFQRWARQERQAWNEAVSNDALLPACLLPSGYLGRKAWRERCESLAAAAEQTRAFTVTSPA